MFEILAIFILGALASFVGAITGGASFISLPGLIFLGLPPHVAVGTNRLGVLGLAIGSAYRFFHSGKIVWKHTIPLSLLGIAAGIGGSQLVMSVKAESLSRLLGIVLICLIPSTLMSGKSGVEQKPRTKWQKAVGYALATALMFVASFVGGGIGSAMYLVLMMTLGITILEATATYSVPVLFLTISSLVTFVAESVVNYPAGAVLFAGMLCGGYGGAHLALAKGDLWVKRLLIGVSLLLSAKLIFDSF